MVSILCKIEPSIKFTIYSYLLPASLFDDLARCFTEIIHPVPRTCTAMPAILPCCTAAILAHIILAAFIGDDLIDIDLPLGIRQIILAILSLLHGIFKDIAILIQKIRSVSFYSRIQFGNNSSMLI